MRVGRARDQIVALLDPVAFLDVDHLALGDQVLDRIAFVRHDRNLALGLVVANEFDPARGLGDDRIVLWPARLEQFGHARQTAGDVAGLGGFAAGPRQHVTGLDLLAIVHRQGGAGRQHIARSLTRIVVQQGHARTQILFPIAVGRTIFGHDAAGHAGRIVRRFGHGAPIDQILVLHDTRLFGDHRGGERVPFGQALAQRHRAAVFLQQMRSVRHAVDGALAVLAIQHHDFAVAGQAEAATALVGDRRDVAIGHGAVAQRFQVRGFVDLRRTADVEGPHRQLRARFADRLGGDDAHRFADVDRRATGKITAVAAGANPLLGFADQRRADTRGLRARRLDPRHRRFVEQRAARHQHRAVLQHHVLGQGPAQDTLGQADAMTEPPCTIERISSARSVPQSSITTTQSCDTSTRRRVR